MLQENARSTTRVRMPALFVGHGSPMNAIEDNRWSRSFAGLAENLPTPAAILVISAHWYVDGTFVTGNLAPETIHDFGGFPSALFKVQYPAKGNPDIASHILSRLGSTNSKIRLDWGLDHGSWSVLKWMYPQAQIPVLQLSIDRRLREEQHLALARSLLTLRDEGILILGSGNIVHNLQDAFSQKRAGTSHIPDWAKRFDEAVLRDVENYQTKSLLALSASADGRKAHPSIDHWLPLLYAYGAAEEGEAVSFPIEGFDWGSLSMRAVLFGAS